VRVKGCPEREDYNHLLNIKMILHAQQASKQVLTIELTDPEQNSFFLYTLDCSETDFHVLRSEQHLLFDFQLFPSYITQHLDSCTSSQQGD
jgi:hypothetical protein